MKPSKFLYSFLLAAGSSLLAISSASAQTDLFWDADGGTTTATGGTGTWGTANTWRSGSATGTLGNWSDNNDAYFGGTAGTVTIGSNVQASSLVFDTAGYVIARSGSATLNLTGTNSTNRIFVNQDATISAVIVGDNALRMIGAGKLTLSGVNTFAGAAIRVETGTLSVGNNQHLSTQGNWITLTNGTLQATGSFNMSDQTTGGSTSSVNYVRRVQIFGSSAIDVTDSNTVGIGTTGSGITDILRNNGTLTKNGTGTLELRLGSGGTNSFNGNTIVSEGTLRLYTQGALPDSPSITVNSGATLRVSDVSGGWSLGSAQTLAGSGGVNGNTTINGTHAPGTNGSSGSQAFTGALTYGASSIFEWDLTQSSNSSGFDTVSATGNISVNTTGTQFKVMLGGSALTDIQATTAFWNPQSGTQTWAMSDIFGKAFSSGAFQTVTTSTDVSAYGSFSINGTSLIWTSVIPEPTSALAGLLLTAGLLRRRRK